MKRPTYTLTSLIKKVFRPGERSLPRSEINQRLKDCLRANGYEMDSEEVLAQVLEMEHSPVCIGHTDAIVELTYQPHQLYDLAYRFLRDTHLPKTVEQIVPELRRQTQFSWNQVRRMLELERDPRFIQYQGENRWYLAEWKVANDRVYQFILQNDLKQISLRTLSYFLEVEVGLSKEDIFLPEIDERFHMDGDAISVNVEPQAAVEPPVALKPQPAVEAQAKEVELASKEVAAASPAILEQLSFEEESFMNTVANQTVAGEVSQLLRQALGRLEERNQHMAQDVVGYFQQNNMQAIEVLMKEKHKNEQIALGLKQVLALAEDQ